MQPSAQAQQPISRAQALRQAQLAMLQGQGPQQAATQRGAAPVGTAKLPAGVKALDSENSWAHPYYWAPFVMSGSWL